jgi:hypothetical protein
MPSYFYHLMKFISYGQTQSDDVYCLRKLWIKISFYFLQVFSFFRLSLKVTRISSWAIMDFICNVFVLFVSFFVLFLSFLFLFQSKIKFHLFARDEWTGSLISSLPFSSIQINFEKYYNEMKAYWLKIKICNVVKIT